MKKRLLAFALSGFVLLSSFPVCAASSNGVSITIGNDGITVDDEEKAIDYEKEYAYSGQDYVYAKVTFKGEKYAINRSQYGTLISKVTAYATPEEYFVGYTTTTSSTTSQTLTEPDPPDWDRRTPWDSWDDEMWLKYYDWADNFKPSAFQKELLDYYSTVELYAYYIGQYSIDEVEYMKYLEAVEAYKKGKSATTASTTTEKQTSIPYEKLEIQYDLFSLYNHTTTYCVTEDNYSNIMSFLNKCDSFSSSSSDTTNPNAFQKGKYYFELGDLQDKMTEYVGIDKDTATNAVKFISSNKIASLKSLSEDEKADVYIVRVCTKTDKDKNMDKTFYLSKQNTMTLITDYLGSNTKVKENMIVATPSLEDDAKG